MLADARGREAQVLAELPDRRLVVEPKVIEDVLARGLHVRLSLQF
jgi:hypothetical protein